MNVTVDHLHVLVEQADGRWVGRVEVTTEGHQRVVVLSLAPHVYQDVAAVFRQSDSARVANRSELDRRTYAKRADRKAQL